MSGRVLVVEDSAAILTLATRVLTSAGYTVTSTATAPEALVLMSESPFDVIVADYGLPGMTGLAMLQKARQLYPGIAAVLVTGTRPGPQMLSDVEALGEDVQVLWKPFRAEDLRAVVDKARRKPPRERTPTPAV
jgi:CheY-like chemotaxis protein